MSLKRLYRLRAVAALPPGVVARRLRREIAILATRWRDRFLASHSRTIPGAGLYRRLPASFPVPAEPWRGELAALAAAALEHRFDLLGSGPVQVAYGEPGTGIEGVRYDPRDRPSPGVNAANRRECRRLASLIDDPGYRPIDWQLDFKSGYRFDARAWRTGVPIGKLPGVDVKVPWELARMQHLPHLALACRIATAAPDDGRFVPPGRYAREYRNQVLDFAAANPPRFGANWVCPMEAGIRVANILLAHDLFAAAGQVFDAAFDAVLVRLVYEHGLFIAGNLEWDETGRSNHYMADVAGLAVVAAYLPRTPVTDVWLAFAATALAQEAFFQFQEDGGSFEGSTAYHCLSAEMLLYATAVLLGLPEDKRQAFKEYDRRLWPGPPALPAAPLPLYPLPGVPGRVSSFSPGYWDRLGCILRFAPAVAKPDGRLPQIGDNDSGRLFRFYPGEDAQDHRHLADAGLGLFADPVLAAYAGKRTCEAWLAAGLAGLAPGERIPGKRESEAHSVDDEAEFRRLRDVSLAENDTTSNTLEIPLPLPEVDTAALSPAAFPDFGLFVLTGGGFYLAVRCPEPGPKRLFGHSHCDLLALELHHAGRDLITDPGSFLYTPFPALRNAYRGPTAHFVPLLKGLVPADLDRDLFDLSWRVSCRRLCFCRLGFIGELAGADCRVRRVVEILPDRLRVTDVAPARGPALVSPFRPQIEVSDGYGRKTTHPVCAF